MTVDSGGAEASARPEPERAGGAESEPTPVKERTAAAARRARSAVEDVVTGAKESAVEAFDKVIESLDNLANRRD